MASTLFTVGVTYDVVTPESAEHGDFADSGWTVEKEPHTLRDALSVLRRYGPYDSVSDTYNGVSMYESDADVDFRTGAATRYCVHIEGSSRNIARLLKLAKVS